MLVKEVMTANMEQVGPATPLMESAARMRDLSIGSLAVTDAGRLVGIVTDRDITCRGVAAGCDPATTEVSKVMSKDVAYCYDDQYVPEVVEMMEGRAVRRLPVVDHQEHLVGVVSLTDLSHAVSEQLSGHVMRTVSERH
ncbi:MAG: CBS domain-containing protein [Kiloniellales bacterium]